MNIQKDKGRIGNTFGFGILLFLNAATLGMAFNTGEAFSIIVGLLDAVVLSVVAIVLYKNEQKK